jgi:polysaccharide pyruvyl transferase WcaK-like protein
MKILVLGWYGHHNIGDESYKETFRSLFPNHELTFTDSLKESLVGQNDVIILGGGNVLRQGFLNQLQGIQKPIYGFSLGMEELPQCDLSFFKHIYTRDIVTLEKLKELNIPCSFIPDAALILEPNAAAGKSWLEKKFADEKCDLYSNIVTVVVNSYMLNGSLNGLARDAFSFIKFSYDFARVIDETPASFVFVPFGTQLPFDDRVANSWVAAKCKYWKKNLVVFDRLNYQETLNVIAASNLTISSRLHSSIFSFVAGTPFIDVTHHSKNNLFLQLIGKSENSINFWQFDSEELKDKINKLMYLPKHEECKMFKQQIWETVDAIRFAKQE